MRSTISRLFAEIAIGRHTLWVVLILTGILMSPGCAYFEPVPLGQVEATFRERAITQTEGNVGVTAVVLSEEETEQVFALDLYDQGVDKNWNPPRFEDEEEKEKAKTAKKTGRK